MSATHCIVRPSSQGSGSIRKHSSRVIGSGWRGGRPRVRHLRTSRVRRSTLQGRKLDDERPLMSQSGFPQLIIHGVPN